MHYTARACQGMVVAPHRLACGAGLDVLRQGGNAVEAAIATAAALSVVYPHMTGLGGDAFWLILPADQARTPRNGARNDEGQGDGPQEDGARGDIAREAPPPAVRTTESGGQPLPDPMSTELAAVSAADQASAGRVRPESAPAHSGRLAPAGRASVAPPPLAGPVAIDACGRSAIFGSRAWYTAQGCAAVPKRGPLAALTMAGAVSGWQQALALAADWPGGPPLPLEVLFADAIRLAEEGFPVTDSQSGMTAAALGELGNLPGFAAQFLQNGRAPAPGSRQRLPRLARTLRRLAEEGLDSFYRGPLAEELAGELTAAGSPLRREDFAAHTALTAAPLRLRTSVGMVYNTPPPTQGISSLMILGLVERFAARHNLDLRRDKTLVHAVAEATKQAFFLRDRHVADPAYMKRSASSLLDPALLDELAVPLSPARALPWPPPPSEQQAGSDTVWFGVMDAYGNTVSCIQSIYHEFGSGLVLPGSGITWHNRGLGFVFAPGHPNSLAPGKKPFHTLNPALAVLSDGRVMAYGSMGGDGQPQTQAALFIRAALLGQPPQRAVSAPRWLLGRAWGAASDSLKLEADFPAAVFRQLRDLGHTVEKTPARCSLMGHAGILIRHPDGLLEGAADPRSDGSAACW